MQRVVMMLILAGLTIGALPGAQADDTGSRPYLMAQAWGTNAYSYQNAGWIGSGTMDCGTPEDVFWAILGNDVGCIGGAFVFTSEAWAFYAPGVTLAQIEAQGVTLYARHAQTVQDDLSGPNVMAAVCNMNPAFNHDSQYGRCDEGQQDTMPDAAALGCGISVIADAEGIHDGNFWTAAVVFMLWVDVQTNEVCIGTSGSTSVVYS